MRINLSQAGKRYNRDWIFRHASLEFLPNNTYAIIGPNGSGKSTLLQAIAGMLQLSEGAISYSKDDVSLPDEKAYEHISFCAPYLELVEEMTLTEFLNFHFQFKQYLPGTDRQIVIDALDLQASANKQIRYFSSGMKQRVKLAQAIFSNTSVVLLDEPCSNLDSAGIELYHSLITNYCNNRLVVVSSNDEIEYRFTTTRFNVLDYKK